MGRWAIGSAGGGWAREAGSGRYDRPVNAPRRQGPTARKCPTCGSWMEWTGQPNLAGPIYVRFFRCPKCGIVRVDVPREGGDGWG